MAFVEAGGLLITHPKWGIAPGMRASDQDNDRYVWRTSGKGRIAFAKSAFDDPGRLHRSPFCSSATVTTS